MAFHHKKIQHIVLISLALMAFFPNRSNSLWLFQQKSDQQHNQDSEQTQEQDAPIQTTTTEQHEQTPSNSFGSRLSVYGTRILSVAGIQPASIAGLLNTVGDTGFRYFNIKDQCRNRAACDLGNMLFKKLSYIHNFLIRTSVRTLTDVNNIYTQSWMEGMLGRNCTTIYATCVESPLEGLMNLVMLQQLAMSNSLTSQALTSTPQTPTTSA